MKKSLLILILIAGLGTAGYYGYQNYLDSQKLYHIAGLGCTLTPRVYRELCALLGEENVKLK